MRNVFTIFKKEFYRVMSDKRLIFTAILLPGLAIYVMYSLMGNAMNNENEDITSHTMIVYTENMPDDLYDAIIDGSTPVEFHDLSESTIDDIKDNIYNGDIDLLIVFPVDFEATLDAYQDIDYVIPDVSVYYNPSEKYSENSYYVVTSLLGNYGYLINLDRHGEDLTIFNTNFEKVYDINKDEARGFAMLLPMLIIMFLFSGAMSIGPDSIAGEKERGTIATLLVTPIKRGELAIGKVLSLSVISLMSATSSFIGIMLSLPNLIGAGGGSSTQIYGLKEYILIFLVLLATVLVIVGLISMISAYAKNIKEASMLILPLYFVSIIVAVSSMFSGEASSSLVTYVIPIYSSINMLVGILMFEIVPLHLIVMIASSLVYVGILIFIINKLFQSEKVMFSK
jgi:sodium transport system permease protein